MFVGMRMDEPNPVMKGWTSLQMQIRKLRPHSHSELAVNSVPPHYPSNKVPASPYDALPLPNDGRQYIRLLTILFGRGTDIVSCELHTHLLDQAPPYTTLSYCWGDPEPAVQIICNGIPMSVGPNLGAALRRLRNQNEFSNTPMSAGPSLDAAFRRLRNRNQSSNAPIWIDAICINQSQSGLAERSVQVSFMKRIYERSVRVFIWLGDGDETTLAAVEHIRTAAKYYRDEDGLRNFDDVLITDFEARASPLKQRRDLPLPLSGDWDAVSKVLDNPWFERVWVLQEASSTVAEVLIGDIEPFPWLELLSAAHWLDFKFYTHKTKGAASSISHAIMAHTRQCKLPMKLETLLEDSHLWLATDPRDKVYALYGLASQSTALNENSLTAPDYQKSVVDVFQDLTRYLLMQPYDDQLDHDILSLVARSGDNGKDGFPSWVPRIDRVYDTDGTWMTDKGLVPSWWWQAGTCLPTEIRDSEPSSLIMKGIIVTEVLYTNVFVSEFSSIFPRTDFRDMYRKLWNYWRSGNSQNEEVFKGKFARTLTAGRIKGYSKGENYPWTASEIDACFVEPNEESDLINKLTFHLRHGWSMIILHGAIFGLSAATNVQKGDVVCVFFGQKVPRVIRPCGDHFTFVGDCYVDDFMFGKATDEWKAGKLKEQWIELR